MNPKTKPTKKTMEAFVSGGMWSYVVNDKGNAFAITLQECGSCTPAHILQEFLDTLPKKKWNEFYEICDKKKEVIV